MGLSPYRDSERPLLQKTQSHLGERFAEIAARHPRRPALGEGERQLSYEALNRLTLALAERIQQAATEAHPVVAVLLPLGALHVAAVLGILRAGGVYLSLDPGYPVARLRTMLRASGAGLLLCTAGERTLAAEAGLGAIEVDLDELLQAGGAPRAPALSPESFACLYFTSGSTGEPKAVAHTHRNILFDVCRQTRDLHVTPEDRFDLLFSPSFSAFLSPVFGALLSGASVHLLDLRKHSVAVLRDWLLRERISISTMSVSTFRRLAGTIPGDLRFPQLRLLSVGAEPLLLNDLELFRGLFEPDCLLQNALATTETRTITQFFQRASEPLAQQVSVGLPVEGKTLQLLDEGGREVHLGEIGEIVIESCFISPGTWDALRALPGRRLPEPRRTFHRTGDLARRLPGGGLVHLGRKDHQIKLRGHRIEAAEIEQVLLSHPALSNAAVFLAPREQEREEHLVALLVLRETVKELPAELRTFLHTRLPDYLIPAVFTACPALPLTETGKLHRSRLPDFHRSLLPQAAPSPAPAPTPHGEGCARGSTDGLEERLLQVWRQVLGRPELGPEEDFFANGGHSLAAVELVCAVEPLLGLKPPQSLLLQAPNCRAFTEACQRLGTETHRIRRVCLQEGRGGRPLYVLPPWNHPSTLFRALTQCEGGELPVWCLEGHDAAKPEATIEDIAALLRQALLAWHPDGNFTLAGFSMGGFLAWEIASQLAAAGQGNPQLLLLDCPRLYAARTDADRQWIARNTGTRGRLLNLLRHSLVPGPLNRRALLRRAVLGKFDWWLRGRWSPRPVDPYEREYLQNIRLSQAYPVRPYTGPVTLVRARHQSDWKNLFSWDLSWREHCRGPFDVVELDCTHLALLQPPHAAELSRVLQRHAGAGACAAANG